MELLVFGLAEFAILLFPTFFSMENNIKIALNAQRSPQNSILVQGIIPRAVNETKNDHRRSHISIASALKSEFCFEFSSSERSCFSFLEELIEGLFEGEAAPSWVLFASLLGAPFPALFDDELTFSLDFLSDM
jgi:hypothetical protein